MKNLCEKQHKSDTFDMPDSIIKIQADAAKMPKDFGQNKSLAAHDVSFRACSLPVTYWEVFAKMRGIPVT